MNSPSFRLSVFAKHSHLGITGYQDPHPEALSRKTSAAMLSPLQDFHPTPRPGQRFMPGDWIFLLSRCRKGCVNLSKLGHAQLKAQPEADNWGCVNLSKLGHAQQGAIKLTEYFSCVNLSKLGHAQPSAGSKRSCTLCQPFKIGSCTTYIAKVWFCPMLCQPFKIGSCTTPSLSFSELLQLCQPFKIGSCTTLKSLTNSIRLLCQPFKIGSCTTDKK
jgi:hypothetical protein